MIRRIFTILFVALLASMQVAAVNYSATFETVGVGHVSLNKRTTIQAGETLRLFVLPADDWELQRVKVVRASDETVELELSDYADPNYTAYSFVAPEDDIIVRTTFVRVWYNISIDQPEEGGIVSVDNVRVREGDQIAIRLYPDVEYKTYWVNVTRDDNSRTVNTYKSNSNLYYFTMPESDVMITVGFTLKEKYTIALSSSEHGSAVVKNSGVLNETIIVTTNPDHGYETERVWAYKAEAIGGGTHYESLEVTKIDDTHYSFVMPAAYVSTGADFRKRSYLVNIIEGTDMADFSFISETGAYEAEGLAVVNIRPKQPDYKLVDIVITDKDDNELEYSIDEDMFTGQTIYYVYFTMPFSEVNVRAKLKAPQAYPVDVLAEGTGGLVSDKETAYPGETVTLTVSPDTDCSLKSITAVVGYEVKGGGGGAHAPRGAASVWYKQQDLEVTKVDATHYQFTLPDVLASDLTPNYLDDTRIKVSAELVYVGPQVIYCDDNKTLYFVYDTPNPEYLIVGDEYDGHTITNIWNGDIITSTGWGTPGWSGISTRVDTVVFKESFAALRPTSCNKWFNNFKSLTEIVGLENLNTSEVTVMNSMFMACVSLPMLNLSSFDVSKVTNATTMFRADAQLTTIYCNDTWNIPTADYLFMACGSLVGAVPFNSSSYQIDMANPRTGYFTGKWAITIPTMEHGTVTCEQSHAYTNEQVTITVVPENGYELESLTISSDADAGGNPSNSPAFAPRRASVDYTAGENGTYTFAMPPGNITLNATFTESSPTGIDDIDAAKRRQGVRYNVLGQPVGEDYQGIVIENGKKIMR